MEGEKLGYKKILVKCERISSKAPKKAFRKCKLDYRHSENFMDDVPRTNKAIDGLILEGLSLGKEIWSRLDQVRNLYYGRIEWMRLRG